ncbi:HD domain-containing protein [Paenibacillus sp. S-38]|uniref:HD domain-containing protein n=1 Tax=Paenibacillus sp. S-38 TaxID=3416710 RepID=UPI003CF756A4
MHFLFQSGQRVWEPLYQLQIEPEPFERELFQSAPLRRLKHVHHYGAGSLISRMVHSRLEHTIGVWTLARHFFSGWRELHAAAIVHDTGHLPFSHSIERVLGLNHHQYTERAILSDPLAPILKRHGLAPHAIIDLLNRDTPLSHRSDFLGLDHLDSFLRDTWSAGQAERAPAELMRRLSFRGPYAEADEEAAVHLMKAIAADHRIFLSPMFLAADELLGRAAALHVERGLRGPSMLSPP